MSRAALLEQEGRPQVDSSSPHGRPRAETHRRTRRNRTDWSCWTLPSRRRASLLAQSQCGRRRRCPWLAARSPRGPQPMAKSWGRAGSTGLRTLPALPAPPDDALPPPLFIRARRPSRRLGALRCGRRSGRGAARPRRLGGRMGPPLSPSPSSPPRTRSRARLEPGRPAVPRTGSRDPAAAAATLRAARAKAGETDRQRPPPLLPPPQLGSRAHTKEGEERRRSGLNRLRGLDSS